jgi:hypothetical protein
LCAFPVGRAHRLSGALLDVGVAFVVDREARGAGWSGACVGGKAWPALAVGTRNGRAVSSRRAHPRVLV